MLRDVQRRLVEDAGSGTGLLQDLFDQHIPAIGIKPEGDEVLRMSPQTAKIEAGLHDDQVDSISQALNWMSSRSKRRALFTSV
jgi:phage terminase large subunit-like protein